MSKTYWEKLRDPRWQKKRLDVMNRAEFTCEHCRAKDKTLNVHHKIYRKGAMPWEYADSELQCICEDCHEIVTGWRKRLEEAIARMDPRCLDELTGYAEALGMAGRIYSDPPNEEPWVPLSEEHARGFLAYARVIAYHEEAAQLMDAAPISADDFREMAVRDVPVATLIARKRATN